MGITPKDGVCAECGLTRKIGSRNLCGRCYWTPELRVKHAPNRSRRIRDLTKEPPFGRLTVLSFVRVDAHHHRVWLCECACGKRVEVPTNALVTGNTKSCGCWKDEQTGNRNRTHGMSRSRVYGIWCLMRARCGDPTSEDYPAYGGRGIHVCAEWQDSFEAFRDAVGERPSKRHSLDRIDTNKGYEPGNVRWVEQKAQCNNKRSNAIIAFEGESLTLAQWAERAGVSGHTLRRRIKRGTPLADAMTPGDLRASTGTGAAMSSERGTWYAMHRRCEKPDDESYPDYGGRGIAVCDRWSGKDGFAHFLADMGKRPGKGYSLDRADVNGPYAPENCRWSLARTQARNTRRNRMYTHGGETMCAAAWAERAGIPQYIFHQRIRRGWSLERILSTPAKLLPRI